MKPAVRTPVTQLPSTESPGFTKQESERSLPTQLSMEVDQAQDTTSPTMPAKPESCPETGTVKPSTKDVKAIISATKEPSPASITIKDEPMEVSTSEPLGWGEVGAGTLETAPKELHKEMREGHVHRKLAEASESPGSSALEDMDTTPESKSNLSFLSPSPEEKPRKASLDRLAEMAASPTHSSPLARGTSPKELPQSHTISPLGDHSNVGPTTTTLIPLTPKIGMGKPAISKRKFSPGRPRVKQVGAWASQQI